MATRVIQLVISALTVTMITATEIGRYTLADEQLNENFHELGLTKSKQFYKSLKQNAMVHTVVQVDKRVIRYLIGTM